MNIERLQKQLKSELQTKIRETNSWIEISEKKLEFLVKSKDSHFTRTQSDKERDKLATYQEVIEDLNSRLRDIELGKYDEVKQEVKVSKENENSKKKKIVSEDEESEDVKDDFTGRRMPSEWAMRKEYNKFLHVSNVFEAIHGKRMHYLKKMPNNQGFIRHADSYSLCYFGEKDGETFYDKRGNFRTKPLRLTETIRNKETKKMETFIHVYSFNKYKKYIREFEDVFAEVGKGKKKIKKKVGTNKKDILIEERDRKCKKTQAVSLMDYLVA